MGTATNKIRRQIMVKGLNWLPCVVRCQCGEWRGGYLDGKVDKCKKCGNSAYKWIVKKVKDFK